MRKIIKNILVFLLFAINCYYGYAQSKVPGIIVELSSGQKVEYMLVDKPKLVYDGSKITLSTVAVTVEYTPANLLKVMPGEVQNFGSGIHEQNADDSSIKLDGGFVRFSGFVADEGVRVFNTAGLLVATHHVSSDGSLVISISSLPSGISIIKTNNQLFKFLKR
jgi:hypothetical protein